MDSRTQERVEQWDSRPFSGGYDGLRDLVASDFSGAVTAAGSWLFLLNGRIVGTVDGDVDDFENSSGTVYEAPHPSLPLLCAMEERGGETRAKYYTNETPLDEVDATLQDGSFTGYVELSENVLSGDYYAVYYGGRRMAAAYVGSAERLLTGDDAFERAADEVGIYEVIDVEIDVTDVPGPGEPEPPEAPSEPNATDPAVESDAQPIADDRESSTAEDEVEPRADSTARPDSTEVEPPSTPGERPNEDSSITTTGEADADRSATPGITDSGEETASSDEREADGSATADSGTAADDASAAEADAGREDRSQGTAAPDPEVVEEAARELDRQDIAWTEDEASQNDRSGENSGHERPEESTVGGNERPDESTVDEDGPPEGSTADGDELEQRLEQEEQWRETRRIPSIDPDNTAARESASTANSSPSRRDAADVASEPNPRRSAQSEAETTQSSRQPAERPDRSPDPDADAAKPDDERRTTSAQRLEQLEQQRESLRATVEELEAERDQLRSKNRELSSTADRLRSRIEELESELERARTGDGADRERAAGTRLSRQEALSQTNLFVRYASKSQPTLKTAHEGRVDRTEVESNLRLEHHTQFDEADAVVDGEPYGDVLTESMEYRFVDWLATELFFEIRDTGHADALGGLYDAIFRIDRVEFRATVSLEDDETEDVPDRVAFDVVAYDKMGSPLLVANLNDSREPASETMLTEMEEAASAVKANYPDLGAAIVVTSSYFEPGALEVVERATGGGFLSRGSQLSYVNLSRKQGYHLCLAESRSEGFHMNVPEL